MLLLLPLECMYHYLFKLSDFIVFCDISFIQTEGPTWISCLDSQLGLSMYWCLIRVHYHNDGQTELGLSLWVPLGTLSHSSHLSTIMAKYNLLFSSIPFPTLPWLTLLSLRNTSLTGKKHNFVRKNTKHSLNTMFSIFTRYYAPLCPGPSGLSECHKPWYECHRSLFCKPGG